MMYMMDLPILIMFFILVVRTGSATPMLEHVLRPLLLMRIDIFTLSLALMTLHIGITEVNGHEEWDAALTGYCALLIF